LTAVHWMKPSLDRMGVQPVRFDCIEFTHPVVRVHPETGRKALYVNESYTKEIVELGPRESTHILALLAEHVKSPDFQMRWHWAPGDLALWDNRSVQHYAVGDYEDDRLTQRVVTAGERPYGPR
jgi:alpha-ketoglutarate-dependent taurine dioxygenase